MVHGMTAANTLVRNIPIRRNKTQKTSKKIIPNRTYGKEAAPCSSVPIPQPARTSGEPGRLFRWTAKRKTVKEEENGACNL